MAIFFCNSVILWFPVSFKFEEQFRIKNWRSDHFFAIRKFCYFWVISNLKRNFIPKFPIKALSPFFSQFENCVHIMRFIFQICSKNLQRFVSINFQSGVPNACQLLLQTETYSTDGMNSNDLALLGICKEKCKSNPNNCTKAAAATDGIVGTVCFCYCWDLLGGGNFDFFL